MVKALLLNFSFIDSDSSHYAYGGSYASDMQKNPSYKQASTPSSYSYHNPAFGHKTSHTEPHWIPMNWIEKGIEYVTVILYNVM